MKRRSILLFLIILTILITASLTLAQEDNLYQQDSLRMQLNVQGKFDLIAENGGANIGKVTTELLLFPVDDVRQQMTEIDTTGTVQDGQVTFIWNDKKN